ncbi:conjugal transfer protein TraN [Cupriavidus sp. TMH.W2]|uniref:conjugal transfer protein TraN n=1 Tax=Cupriavidus sp. TMH.W2 TaxID=3434465 RepID=UPI003D78B04D
MVRSLFKAFYTLAIWLCLAASAHSAQCRFDGQVCVDAAPCRNVNGNQLCLWDVGKSCWTYQRNYTCIKPNYVDYCSAIANTAGCWQTSVACVQVGFDGSCMVQQFTYRCNDPSLPPPPNTVKLDTTYTVTKDALDTSQCDANKSNPLCSLASHTCVEPAGTRVINGLPVYKDCWKWQDDYACIDPAQKSDCQQYIDNGCKKLDEQCISSTDPIGCVMKQVTYSCVTKKGTTTTVEDCSAHTACFQGTCWDTSAPPDDDFAKVVAGMEAAREAGVYGADNMELFKGVAENCRKGYGGLKNCCKTDAGAKSNNSVMMSAAGGAVKFGAKYVFDYAYQSSEWIQAGMGALGYDGIEMASNFGSTFSVYGLSYSTGAAALAAGETGTGMFGQTIYGLGNGFAFDPYSFAAMVAIQVIMELQSCEPAEQQLGMHRGANLCHYVGSYCSSKVFGVCLETKQSYCCYNSKLARIINEGGKPQIGKSWGTPESPQCDGFSPQEFQQVDFSKIDMSEFVGDIMQATELPNADDIQKRMADKMSNITANPMPNQK